MSEVEDWDRETRTLRELYMGVTPAKGDKEGPKNLGDKASTQWKSDKASREKCQ